MNIPGNRTAKIPYGGKSARRKILTAKTPDSENSVRRSLHTESCEKNNTNKKPLNRVDCFLSFLHVMHKFLLRLLTLLIKSTGPCKVVTQFWVCFICIWIKKTQFKFCCITCGVEIISCTVQPVSLYNPGFYFFVYFCTN